MRGAERFAAGQVTAAAVVTFELRWRDDITAKDRLAFDGRTYEIVAPPREIGRRVGLELDCIAQES